MSNHQNVYGICENLCKVPVYSQGQVDEKFEEFAEDITEMKIVNSLPADASSHPTTLYLSKS